jgi:hypothetical protein
LAVSSKAHQRQHDDKAHQHPANVSASAGHSIADDAVAICYGCDRYDRSAGTLRAEVGAAISSTAIAIQSMVLACQTIRSSVRILPGSIRALRAGRPRSFFLVLGFGGKEHGELSRRWSSKAK